MRRLVHGMAAMAFCGLLAGCGSENSVSATTTENVSIQDQCDSSSFNAALGPGTCARNGGVTLSQFNAELSATGVASQWQFVPVSLSARMGDMIMATNNGGEKHTFTAVTQFGGGIVASLNSASGNTTEAPECKSVTSANLMAPGTSVTTQAFVSTGTFLYQCCIHPWMRTTVRVTN